MSNSTAPVVTTELFTAGHQSVTVLKQLQPASITRVTGKCTPRLVTQTSKTASRWLRDIGPIMLLELEACAHLQPEDELLGAGALPRLTQHEMEPSFLSTNPNRINRWL
jgi:hypothetical protein